MELSGLSHTDENAPEIAGSCESARNQGVTLLKALSAVLGDKSGETTRTLRRSTMEEAPATSVSSQPVTNLLSLSNRLVSAVGSAPATGQRLGPAQLPPDVVAALALEVDTPSDHNIHTSASSDYSYCGNSAVFAAVNGRLLPLAPDCACSESACSAWHEPRPGTRQVTALDASCVVGGLDDSSPCQQCPACDLTSRSSCSIASFEDEREHDQRYPHRRGRSHHHTEQNPPPQWPLVSIPSARHGPPQLLTLRHRPRAVGQPSIDLFKAARAAASVHAISVPCGAVRPKCCGMGDCSSTCAKAARRGRAVRRQRIASSPLAGGVRGDDRGDGGRGGRVSVPTAQTLAVTVGGDNAPVTVTTAPGGGTALTSTAFSARASGDDAGGAGRAASAIHNGGDLVRDAFAAIAAADCALRQTGRERSFNAKRGTGGNDDCCLEFDKCCLAYADAFGCGPPRVRTRERLWNGRSEPLDVPRGYGSREEEAEDDEAAYWRHMASLGVFKNDSAQNFRASASVAAADALVAAQRSRTAAVLTAVAEVRAPRGTLTLAEVDAAVAKALQSLRTPHAAATAAGAMDRLAEGGSAAAAATAPTLTTVTRASSAAYVSHSHIATRSSSVHWEDIGDGTAGPGAVEAGQGASAPRRPSVAVEPDANTSVQVDAAERMQRVDSFEFDG